MGDSIKIVPINVLDTDSIIDYDIYSADEGRLIMRGGTVINEETLEHIHKLNNSKSTIGVSLVAYKNLVSSGVIIEPENTPNITAMDAQNREHLREQRKKEDAAGYTDVKDHTLDLLSEIAAAQSVEEASLYAVSD